MVSTNATFVPAGVAGSNLPGFGAALGCTQRKRAMKNSPLADLPGGAAGPRKGAAEGASPQRYLLLLPGGEPCVEPICVESMITRYRSR